MLKEILLLLIVYLTASGCSPVKQPKGLGAVRPFIQRAGPIPFAAMGSDADTSIFVPAVIFPDSTDYFIVPGRPVNDSMGLSGRRYSIEGVAAFYQVPKDEISDSTVYFLDTAQAKFIGQIFRELGATNLYGKGYLGHEYIRFTTIGRFCVGGPWVTEIRIDSTHAKLIVLGEITILPFDKEFPKALTIQGNQLRKLKALIAGLDLGSMKYVDPGDTLESVNGSYYVEIHKPEGYYFFLRRDDYRNEFSQIVTFVSDLIKAKGNR